MENRNSLLTVKEVASRLRLSLTETYKLVQSLAIAHYRVGPGKGAIRIDDKEIEAFLENRRIGHEEKKTVIPVIRSKPMKHIRTKD